MAIEKHWYSRSRWLWLLFPLHLLFRFIVFLRRNLYRFNVLPSVALNVPVVVVGNITVGGTGKTPFVLWLVDRLREAGFNPGIVSRGYGGGCACFPHRVDVETDTAYWVGDEPFMLSKLTQVPVVIDPQRARGAQYLLQQENNIDVIITDDGLQHYALKRDVEIAIVDGSRGFGNGLLMPAGPLREVVARLESVDFTVVNGPSGLKSDAVMALVASRFHSVTAPEKSCAVDAFAAKKATAYAGIGNPQRFFATLRHLGIRLVERPYEDHHQYTQQDFENTENLVLMTEKDAVKCQQLTLTNAWYLSVKVAIDVSFEHQLIQRIKRVANEKKLT